MDSGSDSPYDAAQLTDAVRDRNNSNDDDDDMTKRESLIKGRTEKPKTQSQHSTGIMRDCHMRVSQYEDLLKKTTETDRRRQAKIESTAELEWVDERETYYMLFTQTAMMRGQLLQRRAMGSIISGEKSALCTH